MEEPRPTLTALPFWFLSSIKGGQVSARACYHRPIEQNDAEQHAKEAPTKSQVAGFA